MIYPWQLVSKLLNLNFLHQIDFQFDVEKIIEEYNNALAKLKYSNHFGKHHDGGWKAIALYSKDGNYNTLEEKDKSGSIKTDISNSFPYTVNLVEEIKKKI